MSKDRNTYLKRQRELEKRQKADEKRVRRQKKKADASGSGEPDTASPSATDE